MEQCLMDARKKIEHEIESKAKASLKEGLGQELKTVRTRNLIIFFYLFGFNPFFVHFVMNLIIIFWA